MRKLLVTFIALIMLSSYVTAQKMTFRSYQIIINDENKTSTIENNSTILFLDTSEDKGTLHINPGLAYYIVNSGGVVEEGVDEDGDEYEIAIFNLIDNDRDRCILLIKRWPGLSYVHFFIKYNNFELTYLTTQID